VCERLGTSVVFEPLVASAGGILPSCVAGWFAYRRSAPTLHGDRAPGPQQRLSRWLGQRDWRADSIRQGCRWNWSVRDAGSRSRTPAERA
jgi:hypothetical protein